MSPADFEERFLAQPLVRIRVLNALDCQRLGLMSQETTGLYLRKLREEFGALPDPFRPEQLDEALDTAFEVWKKECADADSRADVDARTYGNFGTVVAFAAFYYQYQSVFAEAEKYLGGSGLSKLAGLIGSSTLRQRMTQPTGISAQEVDGCIQAMQAAAASGKVPLVKDWSGQVWVAPTASVTAGDATYNRDRLGLVHLPRDGKNRPIDTTLMRIEFDSNELAARVLLKRPCVLDNPGNRFRALTAVECTDACATPQSHGFTFSLGSSAHEDGQEELTFTSTSLSELLGWSLSRLAGNLVGLHADTDKHEEFATHLLNRTPQPSSAGAYRRSPWALRNELASVLGCAPPSTCGGHDAS